MSAVLSPLASIRSRVESLHSEVDHLAGYDPLQDEPARFDVLGMAEQAVYLVGEFMAAELPEDCDRETRLQLLRDARETLIEALSAPTLREQSNCVDDARRSLKRFLAVLP